MTKNHTNGWPIRFPGAPGVGESNFGSFQQDNRSKPTHPAIAPAATTLAILTLTLYATPTHAQLDNPAKLVATANQHYANGDYQSALDAYNQAELAQPDAPELAYNRALAHYKLNQLTDAENLLNQALTTRDPALEADIKYNLGNVAYTQALEKQSNTTEAIDLLKKAITRYRDSLDINPDDEDARANIHTAQTLIKDLLNKQKEEQENQQQDGEQCDNPDQQKQDEQNEDQQQKESEQQNEEQQQQDQQQQNEEQQNQDEQQQQEGDQQQQQDQQSQQQSSQQQDDQQEQQPQPTEVREIEMTPEEAEKLLQAVRDKERQREDKKAKRRRVGRRPVLKDW